MMSVPNNFFILLALLVTSASLTRADSLDEAALADSFLAPLSGPLDAAGIDVLHNLNDRELARGRVERPRLGRFPDLPVPSYPLSQEINAWEEEFSNGNLGGLALLRYSGEGLDESGFISAWLDSAESDRLFVSFSAADTEAAGTILEAAAELGWQAQLLQGDESSRAGQLYATTAQRLAIDSEAAREYRGSVPELAWLGERLRRNSDSLFREPGNRDVREVSRNEPSVFLKESLGDEFSESTIREIIVPGGVALGETAVLPDSYRAVRFRDNSLQLLDAEGGVWTTPEIDVADLKALFDFAMRSESIGSDAIVDIDGRGRVSISSALRDTDPGYEIMVADRIPFEYVSNLPVSKSVMIDTDVNWRIDSDNSLTFATEFELRFLSADNMRLAQTRVAMVYDYEADTGLTSYREAWGRDAGRLRENLDTAGLGNEVKVVAEYAGWIGLWRAILAEQIQFTHGRYEFMKLDSAGRETPSRY